MLNFRSLAVVLLLLAVPQLHSQGGSPAASQRSSRFGLYFNPSVTRVSNSVADTGPFAFLGDGNKSAIFGGVEFGGYDEFAHYSKFDLGIDLRDAIEHGNAASLNQLLIGLRIASKPTSFAGVKPYLQLAFGAGRTRSPYNPIHTEKFELGAFAGLDKPLGRRADWRIAEVGYGSVTTVSSALERGNTPVPAAHLLNLSTGFVFRF